MPRFSVPHREFASNPLPGKRIEVIRPSINNFERRAPLEQLAIFQYINCGRLDFAFSTVAKELGDDTITDSIRQEAHFWRTSIKDQIPSMSQYLHDLSQNDLQFLNDEELAALHTSFEFAVWYAKEHGFAMRLVSLLEEREKKLTSLIAQHRNKMSV